MAGLRPPKVADKPFRIFSSEELSRIERACRVNSFEDRRDAAILAVLLATGIRLAELTGIRYHSDDPYRSDIDLEAREIKIGGKGGKHRTVKISHEAGRRLDGYLLAAGEQAWPPRLWLGVNNRGPLNGSGTYQIVVRRGRECEVNARRHGFCHHLSHTWLARAARRATFATKEALKSWYASPECAEAFAISRRHGQAAAELRSRARSGAGSAHPQD